MKPFLTVLALLLIVGAFACQQKIKHSSIEEDQLRSPGEWLRNKAVKDLFDYVRIDTSQAHGEEEGAQFLHNLFECEGVSSEIVCPAPKRCNLLARLPGRSRQGALLLVNHIDVAPIFGTWIEAQPFEGKIKLGYLYGRGSYDMKSIAIAQALALIDLKRKGIVPANDVLFLGEADEESDQRWGSRWLLEHRPEWFSGVSNVLNEGGTIEMILRDVRLWGLETLEAGYGFAELESASREPLERLAAHWPTVASKPVAPHPHVRVAFGFAANHLPFPLTDSLRNLDRVRADPKELATLPDRYASFLEARIRWLGPYGYPPGKQETFREIFVISVPPGTPPEPFLRPILREAEGNSIRVVRQVSSGATTASPYPTPFTDLVKRVTEAHYPGVPFAPMPTFGGYTTSVFFRAKHIPTYGFMPVPANITDAARRHGNDERIFLRDYLSGVDLLRDLVEAFAVADKELSVESRKP